jgi:hypothetical protein
MCIFGLKKQMNARLARKWHEILKEIKETRREIKDFNFA